jgi:hypothetical protein
MHPLNRVLAGTAIFLTVISVQAQAPVPASPAASAPQRVAAVAPPVSGLAASAPGATSPHGRYGIRFTPGWVDMTSQERDKHRTQMLNARTAGDCRRVQAEHSKELAERRYKPLMQPSRDPCAGLLGLPGPH